MTSQVQDAGRVFWFHFCKIYFVYDKNIDLLLQGHAGAKLTLHLQVESTLSSCSRSRKWKSKFPGLSNDSFRFTSLNILFSVVHLFRTFKKQNMILNLPSETKLGIYIDHITTTSGQRCHIAASRAHSQSTHKEPGPTGSLPQQIIWVQSSTVQYSPVQSSTVSLHRNSVKLRQITTLFT